MRADSVIQRRGREGRLEEIMRSRVVRHVNNHRGSVQVRKAHTVVALRADKPSFCSRTDAKINQNIGHKSAT